MRRMRLLLVVMVALSSLVWAEGFDDAKGAFVNATLDLEQMKAEGLPYRSVEDRLFIMNESLVGQDAGKLMQTALLLNKSDDGKAKAFEYFRMIDEANRSGLRPGQDFALVVREARSVRLIKDAAFESRDVVEALEADIRASIAGNDSRVQELFAEVVAAFKAERYAEVVGLVAAARERLEDVEIEKARERAFLGIARRNLSTMVREHAYALFIGVVITIALSVWLFLEVRFVRAKKAQVWTKKALEGAQEGLLLAQKKYYAGELGRATYQQRVVQFHEKERDLKAKLAVWNGNVERFKKWSLVGKLRKG